MKHTKKSAMTLLLASALLLSGCAEKKTSSAPGTDPTTSTDRSNDSSSVYEFSESTASKFESTSSKPESSDFSQSTDSFDSSSYSIDDIMIWDTQRYLDLKGEELIAKFGWPYDAAIDIEGMTVQRIIDPGPGTFVEIPLSEISNRFRWHVKCDYGYLAMTPDNGGEYEYKKYKAGDRILDFTVKEIETYFCNLDAEFGDYFYGVKATFEGETTITGELSIAEHSYGSNIKFYPDEESRKKLPIVNFSPTMELPYFANPTYPPKVDRVEIYLGDIKDYSETEFKNVLSDGTHVRANIKIKDYKYRALSGGAFLGFAEIVDLEII